MSSGEPAVLEPWQLDPSRQPSQLAQTEERLDEKIAALWRLIGSCMKMATFDARVSWDDLPRPYDFRLQASDLSDRCHHQASQLAQEQIDKEIADRLAVGVSNQTNILNKIKAYGDVERAEALWKYELSLDIALGAWKQRRTELLDQSIYQGDGHVDPQQRQAFLDQELQQALDVVETSLREFKQETLAARLAASPVLSEQSARQMLHRPWRPKGSPSLP